MISEILKVAYSHAPKARTSGWIKSDAIFTIYTTQNRYTNVEVWYYIDDYIMKTNGGAISIPTKAIIGFETCGILYGEKTTNE